MCMYIHVYIYSPTSIITYSYYLTNHQGIIQSHRAWQWIRESHLATGVGEHGRWRLLEDRTERMRRSGAAFVKKNWNVVSPNLKEIHGIYSEHFFGEMKRA